MDRLRGVDWQAVRRDSHNVFTKLIRTKDPRDCDGSQQLQVPNRTRLSRCLTTLDLTSLGVGSCVGTGMYLVCGMVARKFAGPAVIFSFMIAALASLFSGACYAEFGVRVPNTTGSAYMYSYVTVGEFVAFVIGWNMILEYVIGTSACARALSACFHTLFDGEMDQYVKATIAGNNDNVMKFDAIDIESTSNYSQAPDFLAFGITLAMMFVLMAGVRKSVFLNNVLNGINFTVWVYIMGAGAFYIDFGNWKDFLPFGWSGVFSGAATCFYAFIGFDIIATTGEEANNPKRSIPLAIVCSLGIILLAYVSSSIMLTLLVPYTEIDQDSALVHMFAYVHAPFSKYVVVFGALAGLTVSMFGSMFPMPRIMFAMAQDGLIFKQLATISENTGMPAIATVVGGVGAALVALLIQLEVLVEMMSIGTLLAYTLVSTCVLVLRYQPHTTNLIDLLPQSLRTPVDPEAAANAETGFNATQTQGMPINQRVMVRRVTRSSPDSDDSLAGDESEDRDDTFLVNPGNAEDKFYGAVPGGCAGNNSRFGRFCDSICRRLHEWSYMCPGYFPWVDCGPATVESGYFVIRATGLLYIVIIAFNMLACYGSPGESTFTCVLMLLLAISILLLLLAISRKPQNRVAMIYATPGLPFVPAIAITVNVYLIMNLSILTLVRFIVWMSFGHWISVLLFLDSWILDTLKSRDVVNFVVNLDGSERSIRMAIYFRYGIKHSTLETAPQQQRLPTPPPPNPLNRTTIPPPSPNQNRPTGDRNIFEGDGPNSFFGNNDPYNMRTNAVTTHATPIQPPDRSSNGRPPWAYPDKHPYGNWDD